MFVDYERATMNAIHHLNQHNEIKGCFYHLSLIMLSAIAFLPLNDVIRDFEELADHLRNVHKGDADDLLEYSEDTYIGR